MIQVSVILLLTILSCTDRNEKPITVNFGKEIIYACTDGTTVKARFGELSDKSLGLAKILMPDGKELTLPQMVSGSGARYTDEYSLEFWIKGEDVAIRKMAENGEWALLAEGTTKK